jgi:hypothetical protein
VWKEAIRHFIQLLKDFDITPAVGTTFLYQQALRAGDNSEDFNNKSKESASASTSNHNGNSGSDDDTNHTHTTTNETKNTTTTATDLGDFKFDFSSGQTSQGIMSFPPIGSPARLPFPTTTCLFDIDTCCRVSMPPSATRKKMGPNLGLIALLWT